MKIAITCMEDQINSTLDTRFGRTRHFFFIESDGKPGYFLPNKQNRQAVQGAGIQAAQTVMKENADILITGHCGPKAFKVLQQAGVRIFQSPSNTSLEDALKEFSENKLNELSIPDVEGHWI